MPERPAFAAMDGALQDAGQRYVLCVGRRCEELPSPPPGKATPFMWAGIVKNHRIASPGESKKGPIAAILAA